MRGRPARQSLLPLERGIAYDIPLRGLFANCKYNLIYRITQLQQLQVRLQT